ncbi:hypothetical protein AB0J72_53030 [Dactylosporangium sp. NPDC049742]|uniref:hypothetical protein n=1 Tax=Dactylosporangium sp. NPDC049742 TaxID=3154737 RepID=UPI0034371869
MVVASGVRYRRLTVPGVADLEGRGVSYAATEIDARACLGRDVVVTRGAFETSVPGLFAVGDVRAGSVKRVASAVGEGSVVVSAVHAYLAATG